MLNPSASYYATKRPNDDFASPLIVTDDITGGYVRIADEGTLGKVQTYDASGNLKGSLLMDASSGSVTLTSAPPPLDGYNLRATSSNTRVTQPFVVQTGSPAGLVLSNTLTGTGIIANTAGGQPTNSGIFLNSTGTITLNNGNLIAGSNIVAMGVQNSGFPAIVARDGSNLQWFSNSTTIDANIGRASAGVLNINAQSNLATSISGSTMVYTGAGGTDLYGNVNFPTNNATYDYNNGSLRYMSAIAMNNGGTIGGVGTMNMVNGSGAGSGTINGLSNINCAGVQPIKITGNGATPTPLITFANTGAITNTNPQNDSILNGTTMTYGSTGNNPLGGIRHFYQANVNANGSSFVTLTGAGLWMFSAQSQTNPAGWSFTLRLFGPSNAQDLLSVGSPPNWTINNNGNPYAFDVILSGSSDPFTVTATRLGAW